MSSFWQTPADLRLIPTSGVLRKDLSLPLPKEWRLVVPGLEQRLGNFIYLHGRKKQMQHLYYLLVSPKWPEMTLGIYQTRVHIDDPVDEWILATSWAEIMLWKQDHREYQVLIYPPDNYSWDWELPEGVRLWNH